MHRLAVIFIEWYVITITEILKMKTLTLSLLLTMVTWTATYACDVCGCSIGGTGMGLMSAYRTNFASLTWQRVAFQGSLLHGSGSFDQFHTLDLNVRYHLYKRWQVQWQQPYRINIRDTQGEISELHGVGDARAWVNYVLLPNVGQTLKWYAEMGVGAQLPTGAYNPQIHTLDLPENFNVGQGNWALLLQPRLIVQWQKAGLLASAIHQRNTASRSGYTFGNQFATQMQAFYQFNLKNNNQWISPYMGFIHERIAQDQYDNGTPVSGTSGTGWFINAGVSLRLQSIMCSASIASPQRQMYSLSEVTAQNRVMVQVSYLF